MNSVSLKRTPPKTTITGEQKLAAPIIIQSGSAPNLTLVDTEFTTARNSKCKREEDVTSFMDEIRELLKSATAQTDSKFLALQKSMEEIIFQNEEIKKSLDFTTKQYDDMVIRIDKIESERKDDRNYISQLEDKVENMERLLFLSRLEVRNIPKLEGESKEDLCKLITNATSVLDVPLQRQEIKEIYRINKKNGTSPIIVDFVSVTTKDKILQNLRNFNQKNSQNKLNTNHIKLTGAAKPIYLSESLTSKSQRLFYLARKFATENDFKFCWTSLGRVFLRQAVGKKHFLIKCEADLNKTELEK